MLTAANAAAQKTLLSLQNVDNTSDANKPVSTAQATADALRVPYTGATGAVNIGSNALTAAGALMQSGTSYVGNFRVNVFNAAMSQWATIGCKGIYGGPADVVFVDAGDGNWSSLNKSFTAYVPVAMSTMRLAGPSGTTVDVAMTRGASGVAEINNGTLGTLRDLSCRSFTLSGAHNLAPITKAALLLLTPTAASAGRWRVTDATPANRGVYPDGTVWRYVSDDTEVT